MNLVVACVLVRGHVDFTPEYVVRLRSMCKRSLPEHTFVCLTDQSAYLPGDMQKIKVKKLDGFAWWTKLELFNPAHQILREAGRVLYLDLDVLIVDRLDDIVSYSPDRMSLVPHAGDFNGKGEKKVVKNYNSSVMCWNGGSYHNLYSDWKPEVTKRLWGDQDWIGENLKDMAKMPIEWFPRLSQVAVDADRFMKDAKVVLCKKPKNAYAASQWPWFDKAWR